MPTNNTGTISDRTNGYAVAKLLERSQYDMVFERFGQVDPQGQNKTTTRKWRRYLSLQPALAPLAEGVPPSGQELTYEDIQCVLEQYGDLVKITDKIADTHTDPVLNEATELCGEQIGETIERLRINFLTAGTNVFFANGVANRSLVNSPATLSDFRNIYRTFRRNKAKFISKIISATANVGTEPVAPAYFAIGHTDLDADIKGIAGFVPVEKYSSAVQALPFEVGKVENIRIILVNTIDAWKEAGVSGSTHLTNGGNGTGKADVYPLLVFAKDAYGMVPLQGYNSVTPHVYNPGQPSPYDPLGQIGFVSWKTYQGGIILNQMYMARLEVAAKQL